DALIASNGDVGASRDRPEAIFDGAGSRILLKNTVRHVLRELLVRASSFGERGDAIAGADDGLAMQGRGRPGYANPRKPIADAKIVVIEGTGIAVLTRQFQSAS